MAQGDRGILAVAWTRECESVVFVISSFGSREIAQSTRLGSTQTQRMDTKDSINLRVLQQQDKTVAKLLKQSPYVVLYTYSMTESSWSKLPFEGTLFIYQTTNGKCGYRILNRLSLECFSRLLDSEEDVMETEGYVIHRIGEEILGFWIWDGEDRTHIFEAMKSAAKLGATAKESPVSNVIDVNALFQPKAATAWTPSTIKG